jgi:SPP1 family predicted phage head-tail adaptor
MKCCDLTAGMLNRKIDFQRQVTAPTASGGETVVWSSYATAWAHIKPMTGSEKIKFDRLGFEQMMKVVIRFRPDLTTLDKVVYRGNQYQIRSIVNIEEADQWLEIMMEKGVAQ